MTTFQIHTVETAPEKSKDLLKGAQAKMGMIPNVLAAISESPALLKSYMDVSGNAAALGTFNATETQVVQMTANYFNECTYCLAAHTTLAEKGGVPRDILNALREDKPLSDKKLEALRLYTKALLEKQGWATDADLKAFFNAGYSKAQALEVILHLSVKLITNYVNHIAQTPLDAAFESNKVEKTAGCGCGSKTSCAA